MIHEVDGYSGYWNNFPDQINGIIGEQGSGSGFMPPW